MPTKRNSAFTLWETIICIVLVGILTAASFPIIHIAADRIALREARAKAQILNCAKLSYSLKKSHTDKSYEKASNEERFIILKPFLKTDSPTLSAFLPKSYTVDFGADLSTPVVLLDPNHQQTAY